MIKVEGVGEEAQPGEMHEVEEPPAPTPLPLPPPPPAPAPAPQSRSALLIIPRFGLSYIEICAMLLIEVGSNPSLTLLKAACMFFFSDICLH
jgi:hypothetical protein